ncbi:unnamed protein product [Ectocarpus sp. 4 AP-2014]
MNKRMVVRRKRDLFLSVFEPRTVCIRNDDRRRRFNLFSRLKKCFVERKDDQRRSLNDVCGTKLRAVLPLHRNKMVVQLEDSRCHLLIDAREKTSDTCIFEPHSPQHSR